ncbi:MAG: transporter substrate-binding domain-containing protein [Candidatus Falkowbacteria bacterium]|nr:transporter substrate-binding domain-containing protein [Candidatus Falkowbacteria bacterium]
MKSNKQSLVRGIKSQKIGRVFILLSIFLALFILLLFAGGLKLSNRLATPKPKVFIASGNSEWAPISYQSSGKLMGIGVDLVTKIFSDLGLKINVQYMGTWDELQAKAKTGEVDVLVGTYKSPEQLDYLGYTSVPYASSSIALFIKKDKKFSYRDWNSLLRKKGVGVIGASYGEEFNDFIKTNNLSLAQATSSRSAFYSVSEGKADYFIFYRDAGEKALLSNKPLSLKITTVPEFITTEDFYIAISKKSPYYKQLAEISKSLYEQRNSSYINYLANKYEALLKPPVNVFK